MLHTETGTQPFFEPAHQLYLRHGFTDGATVHRSAATG
jgi:hypothetical protein